MSFVHGLASAIRTRVRTSLAQVASILGTRGLAKARPVILGDSPVCDARCSGQAACPMRDKRGPIACLGFAAKGTFASTKGLAAEVRCRLGHCRAPQLPKASSHVAANCMLRCRCTSHQVCTISSDIPASSFCEQCTQWKPENARRASMLRARNRSSGV